AFDAARDVLRENRFDLNRVDGHAGVITTFTKPSAGLLSPWDSEQSTFGQEVDDLMDYQQRRIRVTFEPISTPATAPPSPPGPPGRGGARRALTVLSGSGETIMRIRATIERIERPIWRPDTTAVGLYTRAVDPDLVRRGLQPSYTVPVSEDPLLAARLVEGARQRLAEAQPHSPPGTST